MKNEMLTVLRNDFLSFARKALRELDGTVLSKDRYIEYLTSKLTDFADGGTRRLLCNQPPRTLKTSLGSGCLPAWILGHRPSTRIMILSYSEDLAELIARSIRSILAAEWYRAIFPTRIKKGHAKAMNFATAAGGGVFAASINGSITGHGADVIIVDDPHNITDAGNPEQLDRTIERFNTVIRSRLNNRKTGRILVIAHRISDRDLSAHLLAQGKWDHLALPFIATRDETYKTAYTRWHRRKGELLRPDAEDEDDIAQLRKTLVNPDFEMLFQQDCDRQARLPIRADYFLTFTPGDFAHLPCVLSIDTGTTDGDDVSFTVIQTWAFGERNFYLIAQYREQCEFDKLKRMVRNFRRRHRPIAILVEKTANGPALISELRRKSKGRHLIVPITPRGSKSARFNRHVDKIRDGRVHLPEDAEFYAEFAAELESFPHGEHTDQVDAFTQMADWVDQYGKVHLCGRIAKPQGSTPPSVPMAVGCSSQFFRFGHRTLSTNKPGQPGICVVRGNSFYTPNGPFRRR
jgi:predicted phage terminase large subunit-like protein